MNLMENFLYTMVSYATCITLCSLGGQLTGLAGRFNLGMEGMMLFGGFFSLYFTNMFQNLFLGLLMGVLITVLVGLFMAFMNIRLKVDIYIVGMAVNTLGTGLTTFLIYFLTGSQASVIYRGIPQLKNFATPLIEKIPYLNQVLSNHNWMDYLSILLCFVMSFVLYRTKFGRQLRAVGMSNWVAGARGISVNKYVYWSYLLCGVFCGLAGASLSLPMSIYVGGVVGMTNGRGWLAMAVVILASGSPMVILGSAFVMGALTALGSVLQTTGSFPPDLVLMLPFVGALIASGAYSLTQRKKSQT